MPVTLVTPATVALAVAVARTAAALVVAVVAAIRAEPEAVAATPVAVVGPTMEAPARSIRQEHALAMVRC